MDTTLADLEARLAVQLEDGLHRTYPTGTLEEGIRKALNEYSALRAVVFTIKDLDAAVTTSLPPLHEGMILVGASGFVVEIRAIDAANSFNLVNGAPADLAAWSQKQIVTFREMLSITFNQERIKDLHTAAVPPWDSANPWKMPDKTEGFDF